jgi:hypothetical protein
MRAAAGGIVLGLGALVALATGFPEAQAQRSGGAQVTAGAELVALSFDAGEGRQQITIVDPRQRVMAVYHVDRATGALALKSVRNLQFDLLIEDFNSTNPTPREIRALTPR